MSRGKKPRLRHQLRNRYAKSLSSGQFKSKTIPDKKNRYKRKAKQLADDNIVDDEGDVSELDEIQPSNVRTFRVVNNEEPPTSDDVEAQELIKSGVEMFLNEVQTSTRGFISIIFDADANSYRTIIAGEIDPTFTLGTLAIVQNVILKAIS